ncbi:MAG: DMT family transporter [Chloroflexota bacterium]|nr:DMT family transporter [Chloroflexota bacterium]
MTSRSSRRDHAIGVVLVLISAIGFGSGALLATPVYASGLDWLTLLAWRFLIAAAVSWLWLLAFPAHRAALRRMSRRRVAVLLTLGILYVGNSGTYFAALETVPASLTALIVYMYPALVAVLSIRFGRRLEGRRAWIALGLTTIGVALAVGGIAPGAVPPALGLALALASPVIYAVWIVLAARLGGERSAREGETEPASPAVHSQAVNEPETSEPETSEPAPAAALMTTATFAVWWLAAMATGRPTHPTDIPAEAWLPLLLLGVFSTAVALQTFYAGSRRIGAANASLVSTVEPVYIIAMATLLLSETLTPIQMLGGALVIGGVLLAQTGGSATVHVPSADPHVVPSIRP